MTATVTVEAPVVSDGREVLATRAASKKNRTAAAKSNKLRQSAIEQGATSPMCEWCGQAIGATEEPQKHTDSEGTIHYFCPGCRFAAGDTTTKNGAKLAVTETGEEALSPDGMTKGEAEEVVKRVQARLSTLDKEEKRFAKSVLETDRAIRYDLAQLARRGGLQALGCKNWKEFGAKYFSASKAHIYRLRTAAIAEDNLLNNPDTSEIVKEVNLPERQLRSLATLKTPALQAEALQVAIKSSVGGKQPTAEVVSKSLTARAVTAAVKATKDGATIDAKEAEANRSRQPVTGVGAMEGHRYIVSLKYNEEKKRLTVGIRFQGTLFHDGIDLQEMIEAGVPAALFGNGGNN